jgi:hypothetical protein
VGPLDLANCILLIVSNFVTSLPEFLVFQSGGLGIDGLLVQGSDILPFGVASDVGVPLERVLADMAGECPKSFLTGVRILG